MTLTDLPSQITTLHEHATLLWKQSGVTLREKGFLRLAEENHSFNYQLWHAEDRARRDDKGYEFVYHAKREIDHCNQQRNNRMEEMDVWLYKTLSPSPHTDCTVHSETPGMMIDRLSILALKAYHMALQTKRADVEPAHRDTCENKLAIIHEQQQQLTVCLSQLLEQIMNKTRTFRVYRQLKMYNDPALNPELYVNRELNNTK